jgi:hypothetical protein
MVATTAPPGAARVVLSSANVQVGMAVDTGGATLIAALHLFDPDWF